MSYTYGYFDNQTIGVGDLNKISSNFVSGGVAREPSSVDDLNGYVSDVVLTGVVPESDTSLSVTVTDGKINIAPGTAFFENGTHIKITDEGEIINFAKEGVTNYVYLVSDFDQMKAFPLASTEELTSTETIYYVLLAVVSSDGTTVTDKRQYARGKLAYYGSADINHNIEIENIPIVIEGITSINRKDVYSFEIACNPSFYEKMTFCTGTYVNTSSESKPQYNCVFLDLKTGRAFGFGTTDQRSGYEGYEGTIIYAKNQDSHPSLSIRVESEESCFKFYISVVQGYSSLHEISFPLTINLFAKGGLEYEETV